MKFDENSKINPFSYFSRPKFDITKARKNTVNNPFLSDNIDSEDNYFDGHRSKQRPSQYPKLDANPFKKDENNKKVPFQKGEINYRELFPGLNKNRNRENISNNQDKRERNLIIRPNINIYICDPNYLNNPLNNNIKKIFKTESKKAKEPDKSHNKIQEEKDRLLDLIADIAEAAAPPIDPVSDLAHEMTKLCIEEGCENDKKIYTNDGSGGIGEIYID